MKNGEFIKWDDDGELLSYSNYINGLEDGKSILYYESEDEYCIETEYKNGKREGKRVQYISKGKTESIKSYKNDLLDGEYLEYYENGNVKCKKVVMCVVALVAWDVNKYMAHVDFSREAEIIIIENNLLVAAHNKSPLVHHK